MQRIPIVSSVSGEAESEVAALRAELEHLRNQWHDYAASVSHDVRAPVRHILAFVQILREEYDSADAATMLGYLDRLDQSAQLLGRQVEGLTALSRLARQTPQFQSVDTLTMLQEVAANLGSHHPECQVVWDFPDALPQLHADIVMLREVLWQLMDNAIKFSAGKANPQVRVRCERLPHGVVALEISDQGVGFDASHASSLGRPFQRLHSQQAFAGLGLGLALARTAVQGLGGTLELQSEPGCGCTARVTLREA